MGFEHPTVEEETNLIKKIAQAEQFEPVAYETNRAVAGAVAVAMLLRDEPGEVSVSAAAAREMASTEELAARLDDVLA